MDRCDCRFAVSLVVMVKSDFRWEVAQVVNVVEEPGLSSSKACLDLRRSASETVSALRRFEWVVLRDCVVDGIKECRLQLNAGIDRQ